MEQLYKITESINETVLQLDQVTKKIFEVEDLINSTEGISINRLRTVRLKGVAEFFCSTNRKTFHREEFERNLNQILA